MVESINRSELQAFNNAKIAGIEITQKQADAYVSLRDSQEKEFTKLSDQTLLYKVLTDDQKEPFQKRFSSIKFEN